MIPAPTRHNGEPAGARPPATGANPTTSGAPVGDLAASAPPAVEVNLTDSSPPEGARATGVGATSSGARATGTDFTAAGRPEPDPAAGRPEPDPTAAGRPEPDPTAGRPGADSAAARRRRASDRWLGRRHLERRLHDGAALRLSALALRLGLLDRAAEGDDPDRRARIADLQHELHLVLQELRAVCEHIYPQLLDQAGLAAALRELADTSAGELELEVGADVAGGRFGPVAEGAAYFAVAECLARRPPERSRVVRVAVTTEPGVLVLSARGVDAEYRDRVLDQLDPLGGTAAAVEPPAANGSATALVEHSAPGGELGAELGGTEPSVQPPARPRTVQLRIPRDEGHPGRAG